MLFHIFGANISLLMIGIASQTYITDISRSTSLDLTVMYEWNEPFSLFLANTLNTSQL